jgi:hypothetical protein
LGFATKCPLWLNGWNDMGLTTCEWLVAYVFLDLDVVTKPSHKTQNVCCEKLRKEMWKYWNEGFLKKI